MRKSKKRKRVVTKNKSIKITMINYKGGVGKTTSVYNFCAGLNFLCGKRVLMIDLDPQCSLTNICLKSYSRKNSKQVKIQDLKINHTINHVFKEYLKQISLNIEPQIDLKKLVLKSFYRGHFSTSYDGFDLIPTTMFDREDSNYPEGLDDLEIKIAMNHLGEHTLLNHRTILAKFFKSFNIENDYDFIFFDCPPANSLITQNALVVSDYYLIPSIMDDMSSYGIPHMHNVIQNTIFRRLKRLYQDILDSTPENIYLDYLKKGAPNLLGIFETLRKPNVNNSSVRKLIKDSHHKLFRSVIYNHIDTARTTSDGVSCFTVNIDRNNYSPHVCYGDLISEVLEKINYPFDKEMLDSQKYNYF